MTPDKWTDQDLLNQLDNALRAEHEVPAGLVDAGKAVWTWRTVDAELAALTFDSAAGAPEERLVPTRSEAASLRSLTYVSATLTIDLEVTREGLVGQVQPPQAVSAELVLRDGTSLPLEVEEVGWFTVRPAPRSPFRISCTTGDGVKVVTATIEL
jgi:hypothetical protein